MGTGQRIKEERKKASGVRSLRDRLKKAGGPGKDLFHTDIR